MSATATSEDPRPNMFHHPRSKNNTGITTSSRNHYRSENKNKIVFTMESRTKANVRTPSHVSGNTILGTRISGFRCFFPHLLEAARGVIRAIILSVASRVLSFFSFPRLSFFPPPPFFLGFAVASLHSYPIFAFHAGFNLQRWIPKPSVTFQSGI